MEKSRYVRMLAVAVGSLGLTFCGGGKSDCEDDDCTDTNTTEPSLGVDSLNEGVWEFFVNSADNNTCPFELGIGSGGLFDVSFPGDGRVQFTHESGGQITFDSDGASLFRTRDVQLEVSENCFRHLTGTDEGTILEPGRIAYTTRIDEEALGDCTGVDMTGFPCSYETQGTIEWVE